MGVYQQMGEQHLQRYLAEFDFRMTHRAMLGIGDKARSDLTLTGAQGKRLTHQTIGAN
jgi:hypothetical protein